MSIASDLPIASFSSIRAMQLMRADLAFLPKTLDLMRNLQTGKSDTLADFVRLLNEGGSKLDGQKLAAHCEAAELELLQLQKDGIKFTTILDDAYPSTLSPASMPPAILYYRGDPTILRRASVAVIGSRAVIRRDALTAFKIAANLVGQGYVITSGLARGIDSCAHQGALSGDGKTIGVLPGGLDPRNSFSRSPTISKIIEKGGLIVTPFPSGTGVTKESLLYRNRVTIGLAVGTVVIKADRYSGTMNAAMRTVDMDRPLFVVEQPLWGQDGVVPEDGYGGGFDLIKAPRSTFVKISKAMSTAIMFRDSAPGLPFGHGLSGVHDYPRLYDVLASSAKRFPDVTLHKPRNREAGNFVVVEPDMSEYETSAGHGKRLHKAQVFFQEADDGDIFAPETASGEAFSDPTPFQTRRRQGM